MQSTFLLEEPPANLSRSLGDCREILPTLGPVDHVITDPPFEAEAHTLQRRALGRGQEDGRRDIVGAALPFAAIDEAARQQVSGLMAGLSQGWVLVFCQAEGVQAWRESLEAGGAYESYSLTFHPRHAAKISRAINAAARAAKAGRKLKPVEVITTEAD